MNRYDKQIACGIILSYEARKARVQVLNDSITAIYDSLRSSSDLDGMPHGTAISDPVSAKAEQAEMLIDERNTHQSLINAVDWGKEYITDMYGEVQGGVIIKAVMLSITGDKRTALDAIAAANIPQSSFYWARAALYKQILSYLHIQL